jgi:hypothetical protein
VVVDLSSVGKGKVNLVTFQLLQQQKNGKPTYSLSWEIENSLLPRLLLQGT